MVLFAVGDAIFPDEFSVVGVSNRHSINILSTSSVHLKSRLLLSAHPVPGMSGTSKEGVVEDCSMK